MERVVDKYKLMRYIKLQHELIHARYNEANGKWQLKLRRPVFGSTSTDEQHEIIDDTADFVLAGVGPLSRWSWPDIEGLSSFKGKIMHSANFDTGGNGSWESVAGSWSEQKVGVIGVARLICSILSSTWLIRVVHRDRRRHKLFLLSSLLSSIYITTCAGRHGLRHPLYLTRCRSCWDVIRRQLAVSYTKIHCIAVVDLLPEQRLDIITGKEKEALKDPELFAKFRHELESDVNVSS